MTLAITVGEPAGIGPELCAMVAAGQLPSAVVAIGDAELIRERAALTGIAITVTAAETVGAHHTPGILPVLDLPMSNRNCLGRPDTANAPALIAGLNAAIDGCASGHFSAMVTAPLQKSVLIDGGYAFSGHTEYVAERTQATLPVMLLANSDLRVALATTHLPLRAVADHITTQRVNDVLDVMWCGLRDLYGIESPTIAVCGLNPHAGESGHLGHEDDAHIRPAIEAQQALGRAVSGPFPADSIFSHQGKNADAILAMYHDQGLPVIKDRGFGSLVNLTLGLPIIRTSVDHGSALDIAGTGSADPSSLQAAIALASELVDRRSAA
ncbi:MAG: 4-hydroxythreonine-4-phosphate dehydrogenase PdxA [Pseudomonadota bacterium]